MIITADLIRKFPFAVAPHRVTDELQVLISRDMAETARAEGHVKRLPPTFSIKAEDIELARRKIESSVFRCLAANGSMTINAIRSYTKLDRHKIDAALAYMVAERTVIRLNRPTRGGSLPAIYDLNPEFKPKEAEQTIYREAIARSA